MFAGRLDCINKKRTARNSYKRLQRNHPSEPLQEAQKRLDLTNKEIKRAMQQVLVKKQTDFDRILSTLGALSPLKIMERGYSLAYSEENV